MQGAVDIDLVLFMMRPQTWFQSAQGKYGLNHEDNDWLAYSCEDISASATNDEASPSNSEFFEFFSQDESASEHIALSSEINSMTSSQFNLSDTEILPTITDMHVFRISQSLCSPLFLQERGVESWRDLL